MIGSISTLVAARAPTFAQRVAMVATPRAPAPKPAVSFDVGLSIPAPPPPSSAPVGTAFGVNFYQGADGSFSTSPPSPTTDPSWSADASVSTTSGGIRTLGKRKPSLRSGGSIVAPAKNPQAAPPDSAPAPRDAASFGADVPDNAIYAVVAALVLGGAVLVYRKMRK